MGAGQGRARGRLAAVLAFLMIAACSDSRLPRTTQLESGTDMPLTTVMGVEGQQLSQNPVALENAKPGTTAWQLADPATAHEIEGYASATSVDRGGSIDFLVNTAASSFNIDIYRMGYYGGAGARLLRSVASVPGRRQPLPCSAPNGTIDCNWNTSFTLNVPADGNPTSLGHWASGIYLAKLSTNAIPRKESYIIFVVRDDARTATYVSLLPVTTYQAYNYWGGKSLYTGCEVHRADWSCADGTPAAREVSFNRPYGKSSNPAAAIGIGAGEFLTNVQNVQEGYPISSAGFDYNMLRWMEKQGYDVKYITNLDLHENPNVLNGARAFVSTGHDEYYSKPMWDRLVAARASGINLAFFSANQVYWQVRFADSSFGTRRNRLMICYRGGGDPVTDNNLTTDQFRWLGRPEGALIGNQYGVEPVMGAVTITNAAHWLYAGTGARNGLALDGLLGYEVNAFVPGISPPQTKILAHSAAGAVAGDMTYYVADSSAQVFATGTMQWSWGLDDYVPNRLRPNYMNAVAQRFTANVFDAMAEKNLVAFRHASRLDLAAPASHDPANVTLADGAQGTQRRNQWRIVAGSDANTYRIVARANGLCLDAQAAHGNRVRVAECNDEEGQQWRLLKSDNKAVLADRRGNKCLEVVTEGGKEVMLSMQGCNHKRSQQQWEMVEQ